MACMHTMLRPGSVCRVYSRRTSADSSGRGPSAMGRALQTRALSRLCYKHAVMGHALQAHALFRMRCRSTAMGRVLQARALFCRRCRHTAMGRARTWRTSSWARESHVRAHARGYFPRGLPTGPFFIFFCFCFKIIILNYAEFKFENAKFKIQHPMLKAPLIF